MLPTEKFPIDLSSYKQLSFSLSNFIINEVNLLQLEKNIQLCRDAIVFYTAYSGVKGLGGHTGRAYDIIPELLIADALIRGNPDMIYPTIFDAAGHGVAAHYLLSALNNNIPLEKLLHHREANSGLPGHPELGVTPGIGFSSGRLGHMFSEVNGVALANRSKKVIMFDSDGSEQEGTSTEAIRFAVQNNLEVKILLDDNNVTISGRPSEYAPNFNLEKLFSALGMNVMQADEKINKSEGIINILQKIISALSVQGPAAVLVKRQMAPYIPNIEGMPKGHDVIPTDSAIDYLGGKGHIEAVDILKSAIPKKTSFVFEGSSVKCSKPRDDFGKIISGLISEIPEQERCSRILVIDSDLEGSCGLHHIRKNHPKIYIQGGISERNNFSAAAGFGSEKNKQGIFGTFSAFQEMLISEITMARMNKRNLIAHFSHAGVDEIPDNTCHFGINILYSDNGFENDNTRLYFPADSVQLEAILKTIFNQQGLRFIYTTRSAVPTILDEQGNEFFSEKNKYQFREGKDDVIRQGSLGYIISYGEMLYRCLDTVEKLKKEKIDIGLINKPTLNVVDENTMKLAGNSPFVLLVESQNYKTGLGSKFGSFLLERGYNPKYKHLGVTKHGIAGLEEQIVHQGLSCDNIYQKVKEML